MELSPRGVILTRVILPRVSLLWSYPPLELSSHGVILPWSYPPMKLSSRGVILTRVILPRVSLLWSYPPLELSSSYSIVSLIALRICVVR